MISNDAELISGGNARFHVDICSGSGVIPEITLLFREGGGDFGYVTHFTLSKKKN